MRKNIYEILNEKHLDIDIEYERLSNLFYEKRWPFSYSVYGYADSNFNKFSKSVAGRCISLSDFNSTYGFLYWNEHEPKTIDVLVDFCEYISFICMQIYPIASDDQKEVLISLKNHLLSCMNDFGFKGCKKGDVVIFVEENPAATAVAEIANEKIAFSVLEYNHHRMKGDLDGKKAILKNMADDIEPQRVKLNGIDSALSSVLFQLFQKFVRHNNDGNPVIAAMTDRETEKWYDEIYQMWLLAKLELDNVDRKKEAKELLGKINSGSV